MKGYNLIVVFNESLDQILLCLRKKNPYKGLSNFIGGKIEIGEDGLHAAYRELEEETSITKEDIQLIHFMNLNYYTYDLYLEVYVGRLNKAVLVSGEENELYWSDLNHDFFDMTKYAGKGNMGHILNEIEFSKDTLFGK